MLVQQCLQILSDLIKDYGKLCSIHKRPIPFILFPVLKEIESRLSDPSFVSENGKRILAWWQKHESSLTEVDDDETELWMTLFKDDSEMVQSLPSVGQIYQAMSSEGKERLWTFLNHFVEKVQEFIATTESSTAATEATTDESPRPSSPSEEVLFYKDLLQKYLRILLLRRLREGDGNDREKQGSIAAPSTSPAAESLQMIQPVFAIQYLWPLLTLDEKEILNSRWKSFQKCIVLMKACGRFLPSINEMTGEIVQGFMKKMETQPSSFPDETDLAGTIHKMIFGNENIMKRAEQEFSKVTEEDTFQAKRSLMDLQKMSQGHQKKKNKKKQKKNKKKNMKNPTEQPPQPQSQPEEKEEGGGHGKGEKTPPRVICETGSGKDEDHHGPMATEFDVTLLTSKIEELKQLFNKE